jgi:hypothetical protein
MKISELPPFVECAPSKPAGATGVPQRQARCDVQHEIALSGHLPA